MSHSKPLEVMTHPLKKIPQYEHEELLTVLQL